LKVVHIITGLATGGAERALYNLLYGGLAKHCDNYVISLGNEGVFGPKIKTLGVPVITLGMPNGRPSLLGLVKLRRSVREFQPDLIQGWMYHGNLAATLACNFAPRCPILVWNIRQSLYDLSYEKPMTRQIIRANRIFSSSPNALLYNSHLSQKQHEAFGISSANGQVIPNGIDMKKFSFFSDLRQSLRSELGIPVDAQVVGHVARLHPMKDHLLFLKAAVDLALRYSRTHFILIGRGVSLENITWKQLVPVSIKDKFHFLNERDDVPALMCTMDIFCLSSAWGEGFPNVIGEAMAIGLPCVATDIGDISTIIGNTGVVVSPHNKEALASGIERLLLMPEEERRMLGANAQAQINANFKLEVIVKEYIELYENLVSRKRVR